MSEFHSSNPDNRWVVLGVAERKRYLRVRCSCPLAIEKEVFKYDFLRGATLSCGCLQKERASAAQTTHGHSRNKARARPTRTYNIWSGMRKRCENQGTPAYKNYGGRGITVCARWRLLYQNFLADMGEAAGELEIDRKDNDKGYWCGKAECSECGPAGREPNCRWVTIKQNSRNQRKTRNLTYEGKTQCISAWEQEKGYPRSLINTRLQMGWSVADAIDTPPDMTKKKGGGQQYSYDGRTQNCAAWAAESGVPENVLRERLRAGWDMHRALTEPIQEKFALSREQEDAVRARYDKGSHKNGGPALAKEYGVSMQTIFRIVKGASWRYADDTPPIPLAPPPPAG